MRFQFLVGMLTFSALASASASEFQPYVNVQSISYSQPIAIGAMLGEWNPPFKGGDKAFTYNKAEVGQTWHHWQLGIFRRYDYLLEFSRQTAELYYLTENHLPLEPGKEYSIRIKARHQVSRGLRLGFQHKLTPSLNGGLAASYLQGLALIDGDLKGKATATSDKDYDFQFDTDYVYSRDVLFERDVSRPQGNGYSIDLSLDWQPTEQLAAQLTVIDLMGKLYWKDAPYTTATASSNNKTYDEDGYVRYNPVISGYESYKDFVQAFPRKVFLSAQYQLPGNAEILAEVQDFEIARFVSLGAGTRLSSGTRLQGLYNFSVKALTLRYIRNQFHFEMGSDDIHADRARYFALQISYNLTF